MADFQFPKWVDRSRPLVGLVAVLVPVYALGMLYYGGSPQTTNVGYSPKQPVLFSHALHAGQLGMDCRYCHNTVEQAAMAAVPSTGICMNCHARIAPDSVQLEPVRRSAATGQPIPWVRVHDLPDYVYFDHSAHVTRGVSCVECHGRIDTMTQVHQVNTLSMGWCLDCHRNPAPHLRPQEFITDLDWVPEEERLAVGLKVQEDNNIHPPTDCSTCHR